VLGTDFGDRNLFLKSVCALRLGFGYNATVALKRRAFPDLPPNKPRRCWSLRPGAAFRAGAFRIYVAGFNKALVVAGARPSMLGV